MNGVVARRRLARPYVEQLLVPTRAAFCDLVEIVTGLAMIGDDLERLTKMPLRIVETVRLEGGHTFDDRPFDSVEIGVGFALELRSQDRSLRVVFVENRKAREDGQRFFALTCIPLGLGFGQEVVHATSKLSACGTHPGRRRSGSRDRLEPERTGFGLRLRGRLPPVDKLLQYQLPVATRVYAADGTLLGEFYTEKRYLVPIAKIPPVVRQAFIAAEDSNFYHHKGVDVLGIARAAIANFTAGSVVQGGSTITQQVVKSLLLSPEKSYERKLKEILLSLRLERQLTKDEILYLYLNLIYLGNGSYGVGAAAQEYFNKDVADLDLAEAALLAGLPQAPSRYSPVRHWDRAKYRQRYVLERMARERFVTWEESEQALKEEIQLTRHDAGAPPAAHPFQPRSQPCHEPPGAQNENASTRTSRRVFSSAARRKTKRKRLPRALSTRCVRRKVSRRKQARHRSTTSRRVAVVACTPAAAHKAAHTASFTKKRVPRTLPDDRR